MEDTEQGDYCRHDAPTRFGVSYYSTALCRNKNPLSFNLKNKEVLEHFRTSIKADVIIESFRPGVTKRLGIDYETVRVLNPGIVYTSISAFGQNDERSLQSISRLKYASTLRVY